MAVKRKGPPKKVATSRATAMKQADRYFSLFKRLAAAYGDGMVHCFICGKAVDWKAAELMHFRPRRCMSTRYDAEGCQPGCHECNTKSLGDWENFAERLDHVFGPGTADGITEKSKRTLKMTTDDLMGIYRRYRREYENMKANW